MPPTPSRRAVEDLVRLSAPDVDETDRQALLEAFDTGWIAPVGPAIADFEDRLREATGAQAAVALSSGTAALHLALTVAGVRPGDTVLVPTATFAATAFAVLHAEARPIFVDVSESTWCLDATLVERYLEHTSSRGLPTPRAMIPVDLYGYIPDYLELRRIAARFGIAIIEDAAEALGSSLEGQPAGSLGDLGVLSFNGNKIITTSGGGALLGPTERIEHARHLSTQARLPTLHYEHDEVGYNYRLSNILAALGSSQIARLPQKVARRQSILDLYQRELADVSWLRPLANSEANAWLSVCMLGPSWPSPREVCSRLASLGVEARPFWKPMHQQPVFQAAERVGGEVAASLYRRGLCLPTGSGLTDSQISRVVSALHRIRQ